HTMPAIRTELTDTDKELLSELLKGDRHAYALAAKTRIKKPTVVSSLKKLEEHEFIESRVEQNEGGVNRKVFTLAPPVFELIALNFDAGCEVLASAMTEERLYPQSDKKALL